MSIRNHFKPTVILIILTLSCVNFALAQTVNFAEPRQEKLLNGLKLLIWNEPKAEKVTVKLRVHNGAAFDPKDKMGVMALLADILFPTEPAKAFFTEDLEGSLEVTSNFDYIQITATGKSDEIQAMLDTLATAITNPQITQENFLLVRNARLEKVKELEKNPAYVADRAVAKRLFGDFPYGKSAEGTSESLAKIDRVDLLLARDRFFTSDNATLAVIGNVKSDFVYRATRQLFGAWKKSDKLTPATFRQPDAPLSGNHFVEFPDYEKAEIYQASRGVARNNKDYQALLVLADTLSERLKNSANNFGGQAFVSSEPHLLFGILVVGVSVPSDKALAFTEAIRKSNFLLKISDGEFEKSKASRISEMNKLLSEKTTLADFWLDADTYKLPPLAQQYRDVQGITLSDVNNVLDNVLKGAPFVSVAVGDSAKLKDFLKGTYTEVK